MKCKYCGKELSNTAKFCDECGAKTDYEEKTAVKTEIVYNYPKNNNSLLKSVVIFLVLIIAAGVGFGMWYLNSNEEENTPVEEKKDEKKDDKKEEKNNIVKIDKYSVTLPPTFSYYSFENNNYIQNEDCIITYMKYNLSYGQMINSKDSIINEFNAKGFNVTSFEPKNIDGFDCILVTGNINEIEYGYLFTDIKNETPIFFTISSSTLGSFNSEWFNYPIELLKNISN